MRILMLHHHRRHKAQFRAGPFARELAARGHEVTLACTADHARWKVHASVEAGVQWVEFPDLLVGQARSGWDPWTTWRRLRYFRGSRFELIHAFETRPATIYPLMSLLRRHPVPLVIDWVDWWGHGGLIREHRPRWYQFLFGGIETWYEENFRTRADSTTVIADGLAKRAVGLGVDPDSVFRIWNGAPVDSMPCVSPREHRERFGIPADAFVIGDSGKDVLIGVDQVMEAIAIAAKRIPQILLMMTGENQERLIRQADRLGIANAFRHLGFLPYKDLPAALSCSDVFVVPFPDRPANRGRWPGKIGKYLAAGRPVVTNPVGEMKYLIESHGVGLLADESPEGLAEALVALHADPERRRVLGEKARLFAENHLRWSLLTDKIEAAYAHAIERFHSRVGSK